MSDARPIVLPPFDRHLYEQSGNGLHAWAAYRRARQRQGWPEEWVLEYFDRCHKALTAAGGTSSPEAVAEALQLRTRGGGPAARARAMTAQRAQGVVTHAQVYRRLALAQIGRRRLTQRHSADILERVASESGLSFDRITGGILQLWAVVAPCPGGR